MHPDFSVSSESFLHLVARHGNTEMVEYLLVRGEAVSNNHTPLYWNQGPQACAVYESKMAPRQWKTNLYSLFVKALYIVYIL